MSMLSLSDLLRRRENNLDDDRHFDRDGTFEHDIEAALELEVESEFSAQEESLQDDTQAYAEAAEPEAEAPNFAPDVLTPHAQSIMAAFSVFDDANNATREELAKIGKSFTSIVTNYNLGRQFLDSCRQEIQRSSELEQANQKLVTENRRLLERTEKQEYARERQDDLLEASKRREARLIQDCDALRMNVSDLRLEVIELRNANAAAEHARSEMHMSFATKSAEVDRLAREIEVLREKLAGTTSDLDAAQRRQAEMRSKYEELHAVHATELSKSSDLNGRAAAGDKEVLRLQKLYDSTDAQLKETSLALQNAEHDIWERDRRYQSEMQAMKNEVEQLSNRLLQYAGRTDARQQHDDSDETAAPLIPLRPRQERAPRTAKAKQTRRPMGEVTAAAAE